MGSSIHFAIFSALFFFDVLSVGQDGDCRELVFPQFFFVANKRLVNHTIKTEDVQDMDYCEWLCYKEPNCVSVNFEIEAQKCELNNATHRKHGAELEDNDSFLYHGADSACDTDHCQNGGVCQSGYTDKGYRCVCLPGFTSDQCEQDIDECSGDKNNCDPDAICTNIEGSYNCTCKEGFFGDGRSCARATSCKHIRDMDLSNRKEDGYYWIDPASNGIDLKVFCDMTTDGGGWLLVSKVVMNSSTPPTQAPVKTSYRGIASNEMLLTKTAMNELRKHINFSQLRFHCNKEQPGRTFHITTADNSSGEAVVQYFSGQTDVVPEACSSFVKMHDDESELATKCIKWGKDNTYYVGKWSLPGVTEDRLYNHPAFAWNSNHWLLGYNGTNFRGRFECDDYEKNVSAGDFWKIYVR
ncbi:uncharacterized protein [Montipora capricornis]|uniref:uncharacterized protein isoform X1 n=2 Tax=Montipora capricornis TaxID=246305 RepID=UPI0035F1AF58